MFWTVTHHHYILKNNGWIDFPLKKQDPCSFFISRFSFSMIHKLSGHSEAFRTGSLRLLQFFHGHTEMVPADIFLWPHTIHPVPSLLPVYSSFHQTRLPRSCHNKIFRTKTAVRTLQCFECDIRKSVTWSLLAFTILLWLLTEAKSKPDLLSLMKFSISPRLQ